MLSVTVPTRLSATPRRNSPGNGSNPLISNTTPELSVDKKGHILLEDATANKTFMEKVYAGGDIVLGAATVILAMGEGRRAAAGINEFLKK